MEEGVVANIGADAASIDVAGAVKLLRVHADRAVAALAAAGVDLEEVTHSLQVEAVEKFVTPFRSLLQSIEEKLTRLASA